MFAMRRSLSVVSRGQRFVATSRYFSTKFYTKSDEWISVDGDNFTLGVSNYAQEQMGDCVFVDLPQPGDNHSAGDSIVTVESTKAVADVYTPFDIEVTEVNEELEDNSGLVNEDAEGEGWFIKGTSSEISTEGLMDKDAYDAYCSDRDDH